MGAVGRHRGERARDLPEQWADLGDIALLVACQLAGEDLAGARIDCEMEFAPGPGIALAMLLDQPLACAVDLQARRVDHDVHRPASLGVRQRRSECQPGTAPRERGVVGHADIDPEQAGDRAQQALGLPPRLLISPVPDPEEM